MNKKNKETIEELMKDDIEEQPELKEEIKNEKEKGKKSKVWVILLVVLLALVITGSGYAAWLAYQANQELKRETKKTETVVEPKKKESENKKEVYVSATGGLNLRKDASVASDKLATIPDGTKLTVLEEKNGWYKVEYNGQTGWINKEYTTTEKQQDIIYTNNDYKFQLTLPAAWKGYSVKVTKPANNEATAYLYFQMPTTNADWLKQGNKTPSLFAISVYTKDQWQKWQSSGAPGGNVLNDLSQYVFTISQSQAAPSDLLNLREMTDSIGKTLKLI